MEKIGEHTTLQHLQQAAQQREKVEIKTSISVLAADEAKSLRDRQKTIMVLLDRLQLDLNLPPLAEKELVVKARSWESHLTNAGLKHEEYERAYMLAFRIYNNTDFGKGPLTVNHFIQAARRLREIEHRRRTIPRVEYDHSERKMLPAAPKCEICRETGLEWYTDSVGKRRIVYEVVDDKRIPKPCPLCVGVPDSEE